VIAFLHTIMNKPVWHLMGRVDLTGGSTGYHRYVVFDAFMENFSKWYLLGERDPMSWGVWEMRDPTNQYVVEGLNGGLLTLTAFLLVVAFAFGNVGRAVTLLSRSIALQWISWCIGVAIFVHSVTFLGVSYFGQMIVMLYLEFSFASCVYVFARRNARRHGSRGQSIAATPKTEVARTATE